MRAAMRWYSESIGIGVLVVLIPLLVIYIFSLVVGAGDSLMAPLIKTIFGKKVFFVGFFMLIMLLGLLGSFLRTDFGWKMLKPLAQRFFLFELILHGTRSGTIGLIMRLIHSRKEYAPNVMLAPYYRRGGPWPFVILRVFSTTDSEDPIVCGVFLDFPFFVKGGTVSLNDTVFTDITFEEALVFASTSGGGLRDFASPPKKMVLRERINDERFRNFMNSSCLLPGLM